MAKNGTSYTRKGGIYHPLTNTQQVMNPDGTRLEQRLQDEEQAVRGKGEKASAHEYPMRYLGNYGSITALNAALNEIFHTTDPHWQGCLRAHMAGQVIFVSQMALNFSIGDWAQVVTGMVAPSQDGTVLVRSNTPGIYWRSRETQGESVVSRQWQSLSSLVLKTINGQSLIGGGDITISAGGTVAIDEELDETSQNAIANATVAKAVGELWDAIDALPDAAEGGVIVCKKWGNDYVAFSEGDYAYDPLQAAMYKYTSGAWEYQGYPKEGVIYINAPAQSSHYWDGTAMARLLGEAPLSAVNVNSSAPVNSKAVADYVEKERKVVKLTYWGNLAQDANIGEYGYDTNDNQIYLFTDSVDPQGSWVTIGTPKEDLLYLREELSTYYHYDGDEMIAMLDADKMVPSIPETGGTSVFPTAAGVKNYVDGKDAAMKTYVDNAVANIEPSGESPTAKGFGTDNYGNPLFPEYYLPVTFEGETALLGELYNTDDPDARAAAEEYIANIKWGIPFYEWPLRCYNGVMPIDEEDIATTAIDITVFAPEEHNVYKTPGMNITYNTDDVYLNSEDEKFYLKVVDNGTTKYYGAWNNSKEWNDPVTNMARKDCVFSDISFDDNTGLYRRTAKVFGYVTENAWTDIQDATNPLMTDFTDAIRLCMQSTTGKNQGDMRLSDRIYFWGGRNVDNSGVATVNKFIPLYEQSGFTIDGGKGVIFARLFNNFSNDVGHSNQSKTAIFYLRGVSNCKFCNLAIKSLRDRDNVADGSQGDDFRTEISSSDNYMSAFSISNSKTDDNINTGSFPNNGSIRVATHDVEISNIDIQGFNRDFDVNSGNSIQAERTKRITIDGWKSRGGWSNELGNISDLTVRNADYEHRKYAGGRQHIFYVHANVERLYFVNCKFKGADYEASVIDFRESADAHFSHCEIHGGWIFKGNTGGDETSLVSLDNCIIIQSTDKVINNSLACATGTYMVAIGKNSWKFTNCLLMLKNHLAYGPSGLARVTLEDCSVVSSSSDALMFPSDYTGQVYAKNVKSNIGVNKRSGESIIDDRFNSFATEMSNEKTERKDSYSSLANVLFGEVPDTTYSVSSIDAIPKTAIINETCRVNTDIYQCTTSATYCVTRHTVVINDSNGENNYDIQLNNDEHVIFSVEKVEGDTRETIIQKFRDALFALGYSETGWSSKKEGGYAFRTTNLAEDRFYLKIVAKTRGGGYSRTGSPLGTSILIALGSSSESAAADIKTIIGADSGWTLTESVGENGLLSRVSSLESKVIPDAPIAGRSADRPDPAEVGPGYCYFDLQLGTSGKAIFSTGSGWVLADGSDPDS